MPDDVDVILSIPLVAPSLADSLIWHFDQNGLYSVRNGYWVGRRHPASPGSSGLGVASSWWTYLWGLKIPSKVRLFMLRASHHWLLTLAYLAKRGVPMNGLCPRCHNRYETMSHALWVVEIFLRLSGLMRLSFFVSSFGDWFCRNQLVQNLGNLDLGDVVNWATTYLDEWRSINVMAPVSASRNGGLFSRWRPPAEGFWKINTDAASCCKDRLIGMSCIIRDAYGKVKMADVRKLTAMVPLIVVEALAVKCGIHMALEAALVTFQIETDYLQVVNLVRAGSPSSGDVGPIIDKISGFLHSMPSCSIDHISRKGNNAAHFLANRALIESIFVGWTRTLPSWRDLSSLMFLFSFAHSVSKKKDFNSFRLN
ncbi:hypothetical protein Dsin_027751 [Dipteronia sinensis]|uniref:RNase H type-1 domain-containing protein n=1 Tax=Dipteronia sinensis TaxID=43782 RepID=A0AAD9ZPA0_9ROSI|nr:hypothetical protein Dsin_027751 [Dipteronia sinensis]